MKDVYLLDVEDGVFDGRVGKGARVGDVDAAFDDGIDVGDVVALLELFEFLAAAGQFGENALLVAVVHLVVVRRSVAVALLERVFVQFHLFFQTNQPNQQFTVKSI